jgi:hypothetical protein
MDPKLITTVMVGIPAAGGAIAAADERRKRDNEGPVILFVKSIEEPGTQPISESAFRERCTAESSD